MQDRTEDAQPCACCKKLITSAESYWRTGGYVCRECYDSLPAEDDDA